RQAGLIRRTAHRTPNARLSVSQYFVCPTEIMVDTRGKMWFGVQFALFGAILLAPLFGRAGFPLWLRASGAVTMVCGAIIAVRGYQTLGGSHSPWTNPIEGGHFVSTGIYSYVRHPIYSGWIVGTFGLELLARSLVGIGIAVALLVFYDLKSREEEKWLIVQYTDYSAYMMRVKRFVPHLY